VDELYSGTATITIPDEAASLLTDLHREGWLDLTTVIDAAGPTALLPNQCCTIRTAPGGKAAYAIYKALDRPGFRLLKVAERAHGDRRIAPLNIEQAFAYELLSDRDITIVTLAGRAGSGKTLMALLAGHDQLRAGYMQLLIYRPNIEIGQSLGFLPGTLEEKFAPWTRPILDNLELIARGASRSSSVVWRDERSTKNGRKGDKGDRSERGDRGDEGRRDESSRPASEIDDLIQRELLQIAPISHLRGRSIHDAFIIADEAQNTTRHEVKTLLTRSGEGTKVVLTGDPDQIDLTDVGSVSNGLSQLIEAFKGQPEFGHLTMTTTVRSRLAALAANLL
jgi:PhoH-like ATPase